MQDISRSLTNPRQLAGLSPQQRIDAIRRGLPARAVVALAAALGWSQERVIAAFRFKRSTVTAKIRKNEALNPDDSERLFAVMDMIETVGELVSRSGDPHGFDAARCLENWIETPNQTLGGLPSVEYLDTHEGLRILRQLLAQMESGAYA